VPTASDCAQSRCPVFPYQDRLRTRVATFASSVIGHQAGPRQLRTGTRGQVSRICCAAVACRKRPDRGGHLALPAQHVQPRAVRATQRPSLPSQDPCLVPAPASVMLGSRRGRCMGVWTGRLDWPSGLAVGVWTSLDWPFMPALPMIFDRVTRGRKRWAPDGRPRTLTMQDSIICPIAPA
jgi:hypothetical protein